MTRSTTTNSRFLATIELDNNEGRAGLFLRNGEIWCRRLSDGREWPTQVGASATDVEEVIRLVWGHDGRRSWDLQFENQG